MTDRFRAAAWCLVWTLIYLADGTWSYPRLSPDPNCSHNCKFRPLLKRDGCSQRAPSLINGTCQCACTQCTLQARPCDPSPNAECLLGAPRIDPVNPLRCCRPCMDTAVHKCRRALCRPRPNCAELEAVPGQCCPRCKRLISICPNTTCPLLPDCVKYAKHRPGECCATCRRNNAITKGLCTGVRCARGQKCRILPGITGEPQAFCACRLSCPKDPKPVQVCGADGKKYRSRCDLYRLSCLEAMANRPVTTGYCHNRT